MIKTWQQRCEEHPDHDGIVSEGMIRERMQEEIDELRQALAHHVDNVYMSEERVHKTEKSIHEPVAWVVEDGEVDYYTDAVAKIKPGTPLYTAPPKKEWIGLTDEEIKEIIGHWGDTPIKGYTRKLFDQIEAKLREKNS